ncbi:hypothetical protein [Pseudoxanthomonas putridarboris]|uniref:Lipoprotein n=1 Tax=Pseudoxanthomonas putridarboris TaxID=752605 RepID=A0ABU9J463_9GAMM
MTYRSGFLILIVLLAGCATRISAVDKRLILPEGTSRYGMAAHQAFVYPVPLNNPTPAFPAGYAPRELPATTLCVSFVVDAEGLPADVSPLAQAGCAAPESFAPLRDAVLSAVVGWRFKPAMFCDYPDAATRDRDWNGNGCAGERVEARVVPVSLAYAFTFEVRDGQRRVASAKQ